MEKKIYILPQANICKVAHETLMDTGLNTGVSRHDDAWNTGRGKETEFMDDEDNNNETEYDNIWNE